jgi:hypothetical protein
MDLNIERDLALMVPLSERRHRIYPYEIPEVIEGLRLRLETLLEEKRNQKKAEVAFRVMYRLLDGSKGRPKYPEFSWEFLSYYLDLHVPIIEDA